MRLDKFLKVSRIIKRRSVAADASRAGRSELNGRVAKAGSQLRVGDVVALHFGDRVFKFRVLRTDETVKKQDCTDMYEVLSDET